MSKKTEELEQTVKDMETRQANAQTLHDIAKERFSRFEGPSTHYLWHELRDNVDRSLTHLRVMEAIYHRAAAALAEQRAIDKE